MMCRYAGDLSESSLELGGFSEEATRSASGEGGEISSPAPGSSFILLRTSTTSIVGPPSSPFLLRTTSHALWLLVLSCSAWLAFSASAFLLAASISFRGSELTLLPPDFSRRLFWKGDSFPSSIPYLLQIKPWRPPPDLRRSSCVDMSFPRGEEQEEDEAEWKPKSLREGEDIVLA